MKILKTIWANIKNSFKTLFNYLTAKDYRTAAFFIFVFFIGAAAIWSTFIHFIEFSGFAAAFAKALIGIFFIFAYDKIVLRKVDTITEILNGNVAYALFYLGHCIIIAACVAVG